MGIPRFYRWLRDRYPNIKFQLGDSNRQKPIFDNFYIDFNALVYQCIRESGCFLKNKVKPLTIQQINENVFNYLFELVKIVDPQKLLFIGFDGVAPRAKINQSRDRRFKAGIQQIDYFEKIVEELGIKTKQNFQPNSISPGTEFLYDLCSSLKTKIMAMMATEWKNLVVLYSDCCVPGEGQHKIMDFMRYSKKSKLFNDETTHCIYSPDADVILLSLSLNIKYIALIRQDSNLHSSQYWTATSTFRKIGFPQFELVLINIAREYLSIQFEEVLSCVQSITLQNIIDDFVLLMAFVGNDFLPTQFCFVLKEEQMNGLFNSYKQYLKQKKQVINNQGIIDWNNIFQLLKIAKKFEAKMIKEMKNRKKMKTQAKSPSQSLLAFENQKPQTENQLQNSQIENYQVENEELIEGRLHYYKARFNLDHGFGDKKFEDIIQKYIEGLEFYCKYYYKGLPSWKWYYPYHYTPLLCDVYEYIGRTKVNVKLEKGQPYDPFLALMFMLPQQNFSLLPDPIAEALRNKDCILKHPVDYFPSKFELDPFETIKYNKRALIHFLQDDSVRKVYKSIPESKYKKQEKNRNSTGNTILFTGNGKPFSATQVQFNERYEKIIQESLKDKYKKVQEKQRRFPTLTIFGDLKLNDKNKLVVNQKYKWNGQDQQYVFFNGYIGKINKKMTDHVDLSTQIENTYERIMGISGQCETAYTIKRCQFVRQYQHFTMIQTNKEVFAPDYVVFEIPQYEYIKKSQKFNYQQLYHKNERVVILANKYFGYIGQIEELKEQGAVIKLSEAPIKSSERIELFSSDFYTTKYVLSLLDIRLDTLLTIVSEIFILPVMKKKEHTEHLPSSLNFGLNFIDMNRMKIVPKYVRCQFDHETNNPQQIFNYLEYSKEAVDTIEKYVKEFNWLIDYLEENNLGKKKEIRATTIFNSFEKDKINMNVYKQFIKLYKLDSDGSFTSLYSTIADPKLPTFISEQTLKTSVTIPYNHFISRSQAFKAPPAYKSEPEYHFVGDRVIILKTLEVGFIVGVDDFMVIVAVGKKQKLRKINFTDVYNEKWESYLSDKEGKTWSLEPSYYQPTYFNKAQEE